MGNIKNNELEQKERRQINKAASTYLCDQDEGDLYDAYQKLLLASEKGLGDDPADNIVTVWEPLSMRTSVDEMIRLIDCAKDDDDQDFPEVLKKIDWTDLRAQKSVLLAVIDEMEKKKDIRFEELDGILNLIDALQDFAVDNMGVNSIHVYDFEEEDKREGYNGDLTPAKPEPVSVKYKVWVEVERIETDKDGNETYHDEECPIGLAYEDSIEDAVELQNIINDQYGRIM
jgi:hypothetical protein